MNDIEKEMKNLRMILTDSLWRAGRHKRATDEVPYLIADLEYLDLQMGEALERLDRIEANL